MRSVRRGGSSLLIVLILATGAFLFVWMYHPGVLNALLKSGLDGTTKTTAPVDAAQLAKTKEDRWQSVYRPHPVCGRERSELERLECRNDYDNQRAQFEAQWRAEMAGSAKP